MTQPVRTIAIATLAGALCLALTGCVNLDGMIPDISATAAAEPEQTAAPEPELTDAQPGDNISEEQALACRKDLSGPCSAFKLDDGSWVYIDKNAPLPPLVQEAVTGIANSAEVPSGTSTGDQSTSVKEANETRSAIEFATGKRVVVVIYGSWAEGFNTFMGYNAQGINRENIIVSPDKAAVVAAAQAYIAAQANPESIALVVTDK